MKLLLDVPVKTGSMIRKLAKEKNLSFEDYIELMIKKGIEADSGVNDKYRSKLLAECGKEVVIM